MEEITKTPKDSELSSVSKPELKPGIYRHYKGNMYHVHGISRHSESLEKLVVYRCLYAERGLWVRPLGMFMEFVEIDGVDVPRFEWQRFATDEEIAGAIIEHNSDDKLSTGESPAREL